MTDSDERNLRESALKTMSTRIKEVEGFESRSDRFLVVSPRNGVTFPLTSAGQDGNSNSSKSVSLSDVRATTVYNQVCTMKPIEYSSKPNLEVKPNRKLKKNDEFSMSSISDKELEFQMSPRKTRKDVQKVRCLP